MADTGLTNSWELESDGANLTPLASADGETQGSRDDVILTSAAYEIVGSDVDGATSSILVWNPQDVVGTGEGHGDDSARNTLMIAETASPVTVGLEDDPGASAETSSGLALVEPVVLGDVSGSTGDLVRIDYVYSLQDGDSLAINVYALALNGAVLGVTSDAPLTLGKPYAIVEQSPAPSAEPTTFVQSYLSPIAPVEESAPGVSGQLTVTLDSQSGGYNGYFLVEITDPDGTQRIDVLTDNYDRDIGKTFVVDVGVDATVRTGFTVANGANTIWSNNEFAADARNMTGTSAQIFNEDDGGSDFRDLVYTVELTGDAVILLRDGGTLGDGSGNGAATAADGTNASTAIDYQIIDLEATASDLDPVETGGTRGFSENGSLINGATYGSTDDPLSGNVVTMIAGFGNGDGQYDGDNTVSSETFFINGVEHTFDSSSVYNGTVVTFEDGTTATVSAVVFQDTSGKLYLAPEFSNNADTSVYTAKPITSIELGTQDTSGSFGNGLTLERVVDSWVEFSGASDGADGGNDIIDGGAGSDTIFGEGGDDHIKGDAGNDTIYGDNGPQAPEEVRESFSWVNGLNQQTGTVAAHFYATDNAHFQQGVRSEAINTSGIEAGGEAVNDNSSYLSWLNGYDSNASYNLDFSEEVSNISFNITDIDQQSQVGVFAFDENWQAVPVTYDTVLPVDGNGIIHGSGEELPTAESKTATINIEGPSKYIQVYHSGQGGVFISDVFFVDPGAEIIDTSIDGEGGNDKIIGGEDADVMFGEGGDDTFLVGSAQEGAGDVITGGNGPDQTTDFDVLDLRGAGVVTIDEVADADDIGATTGTITFNDGSTLEFSQIEEILADVLDADAIRMGRLFEDTTPFFNQVAAYEAMFQADGYAVDEVTYNAAGDLIGTNGDDLIADGSGDQWIFALDGDDVFDGGAGKDHIHGGAGNDVLRGGADEDLLDGGTGHDILEGGSGIDIFVFRKGDGTTDILDFELRHDVLDLEGFDGLTYEALTAAAEQVGEDVVYTFGTDVMILRGAELATMEEIDLCAR